MILNANALRPRSELVINERVKSCCGRPSGACSCGSTRNAQDTHEHSRAAGRMSLTLGGPGMDHALRAVESSASGDHQGAAASHSQAAKAHWASAGAVGPGGDNSVRKLHQDVAQEHMRAAQAHMLDHAEAGGDREPDPNDPNEASEGEVVENDPMSSTAVAPDETQIAAPDTEFAGSPLSTMNKQRCPECGGEMDSEGECESCGYTENRGNRGNRGRNAMATNTNTMPNTTKPQPQPNTRARAATNTRPQHQAQHQTQTQPQPNTNANVNANTNANTIYSDPLFLPDSGLDGTLRDRAAYAAATDASQVFVRNEGCNDVLPLPLGLGDLVRNEKAEGSNADAGTYGWSPAGGGSVYDPPPRTITPQQMLTQAGLGDYSNEDASGENARRLGLGDDTLPLPQMDWGRQGGTDRSGGSGLMGSRGEPGYSGTTVDTLRRTSYNLPPEDDHTNY